MQSGKTQYCSSETVLLQTAGEELHFWMLFPLDHSSIQKTNVLEETRFNSVFFNTCTDILYCPLKISSFRNSIINLSLYFAESSHHIRVTSSKVALLILFRYYTPLLSPTGTQSDMQHWVPFYVIERKLFYGSNLHAILNRIITWWTALFIMDWTGTLTVCINLSKYTFTFYSLCRIHGHGHKINKNLET